MSIFSSHKRIFLLGFTLVILIAIPFSVYVARERQRVTSKAAASTTLAFEPLEPKVKVGDILTLNIFLDPGTGSSANQVSFVKLSISFDPKKFETTTANLAPNPTAPNTLTTILEDPVYEAGKASISLSIGADPARVVTTKTKIAILKLKALETTDADNPSSITFDPAPDTQVLSIASSDGTSENVLSTTTPATATITSAQSGSASTSTPTPTPTSSASSPSSQSSTPTPAPKVGGFPSSPLTQQEATDQGTDSALFNPITVEPTAIVLPPELALPPTGSSEKIWGIGAIGTILMIIGGLIFISL